MHKYLLLGRAKRRSCGCRGFDKPRRRWTAADIALLVEEFPKQGRKVAALLNRSERAVEIMALSFGLTYVDPDYHPKGWWSPKDDAILLKHYARGGTTVCVPLLPGRTKHAIRSRASELGVSCGYKHRGGCWSRRENKIMRDHYPTGGYYAVKDLLPNRSRDAIFNRATHLKLHRIPTWDAEQERILREAYPRGGIRAAMEALPHHSRQALRAKKQKLGLHLNRPSSLTLASAISTVLTQASNEEDAMSLRETMITA